MSLFWVVRIITLLVFIILLSLSVYFLQRREQYTEIMESRKYNVPLVVIWNICSYLPAELPSDNPFFSVPPFFAKETFIISLLIIGLWAIGFGITLGMLTLRVRKSIGAKTPEQGLITSGPYKFARHPIYLGIISTSFGLAAVFGSFEGLLCILPITLIHFLESRAEEFYDIGVRFGAEFQDFKKRVRMFGPIRFWIAVLVIAGFALAFVVLT